MIAFAVLAGCGPSRQAATDTTAASTETTIDPLTQYRQEATQQADEAERAREKRCAPVRTALKKALERWSRLAALRRSTKAVDRELDGLYRQQQELGCPTDHVEDFVDPEPPGFDPYGDQHPYDDYQPDPPDEPEPDPGP